VVVDARTGGLTGRMSDERHSQVRLLCFSAAAERCSMARFHICAAQVSIDVKLGDVLEGWHGGCSVVVHRWIPRTSVGVLRERLGMCHR